MSDDQVLKQDLAFNELLSNRTEYKATWKLVPSRSQRTDAGFFSLDLCDVDWDSGETLGCASWEAYTHSNGFEMIFARAPVKKVASAIASVRCSWNWIQDIGSQSYRHKEGGTELVVFQLHASPWTLVARAAQSDQPTGMWTLAHEIHWLTKVDTKAFTGTNAIELGINHHPIHQEWIDFEDIPHHQWLSKRGIFVPPYQCAVDENRCFHVYLAGVSTFAVERLDIFVSPDVRNFTLAELKEF